MHSSFQDGLVEYDGMMLSFEDIFVFQGRFSGDFCEIGCLSNRALFLIECRLWFTRCPVMTLIDKVFASNKDLQVVLVPSLRDANHEMVYPQPPFDKKKVCEAFGSPEYAKVCQSAWMSCIFLQVLALKYHAIVFIAHPPDAEPVHVHDQRRRHRHLGTRHRRAAELERVV